MWIAGLLVWVVTDGEREGMPLNSDVILVIPVPQTTLPPVAMC